MTEPPPPAETLHQIIARARCLLLDFDGPICDIYAGLTDITVADHLRKILTGAGVTIPGDIAATPDPLAVFTYSATISAELAAHVETEMTAQEFAAVPGARPNAYVHEVMDACQESGRTVAVVSNNSDQAVRAYLQRHSLDTRVTLIAARTSPDPALLKPSPHLIQLAINELDTSPAECLLVGDSAADIQAAQLAAVDVIGYANRPGKHDTFTTAGATAVVSSLADLVLPLRATSLPN
jgi:phosphoglycolate phosphatase